MRKHLTAEAEQWCRERIGQYNTVLESSRVDAMRIDESRMIATRDELISLLCLFCGADRADLQRLTLKEAMGLVVNVPEDRDAD